MSNRSAFAAMISCVLALISSTALAMIWVGTPVGLSTDPDLGSTSGSFSFQSAQLVACSNGALTVIGAGSVPLGGQLPLPAGIWCGLTLSGASLTVNGTTSFGASLHIEAQASTLTLDVSSPVILAPGQPARVIVLFAPDWLSALGVDPTQPLNITPGHPAYPSLVDELRTESVW